MKINLHAITHTIARAAPLLGSAFAGRGGAAVGTLISAKFGGSSQTSPDDLHALIQADPEAAVKLKQIETDHEVTLQRLTLEAATQEVAGQVEDRSDARSREIATSQILSSQRDHTPAVLAYLLTSGVFTSLGGLFFCSVPEGNQAIVLGIVSSLTTVWVSGMGYFHGSSMGSRAKEASLIHHLHQGLP